jgi:amidohydrolase
MQTSFAPRAAAQSLQKISGWHDELTTLRRDLHAYPELGFEEHRTARVVADALRLLKIDVHTGIGKTGVVAVIEGRSNSSGKMIGLRADMDALPITECNTFAHKSSVPGRMHACGHDGHTAMLLGAARYLAATREFDGTAVLIFQPGEEGYAGAREMIQDGLFERFPCQEVYALHNWPSLPAGTIGISPGPAMAAADRVDITITGKGGHGAHAYLAIDPVLVAAHVITAAQSIVSRNVNPLESAVVSLCSVQAGELDAMSVIPGEALISGTVRTFKREIQDLVEERLKHMVHTIADGFGAKAKVTYTRNYPATINHAKQAMYAADVAASLVGEAHVVRDLPPSMGAEDFSFILQAKPGAYLRLGQGGGEQGRFLHSAQYDFNDAVLPLGAALLASLATHAMPLAGTV